LSASTSSASDDVSVRPYRTSGAHSDLVVDLTAIAPGAAGGVEAVAVGVVSGLVELDVTPRCLIAHGTGEAWRSKLNAHLPELEEIRISLAPGSRWQSVLRRVLPNFLKTSKAVGIVRSFRSRSVAKGAGHSTTWFPFHRSVASAEKSVVTVHDLRVFEPKLASAMDQQIIAANIARASAIVCSWAHPYRHLVRLFPEAQSKTFLVPLPVLNPGPATERSLPDNGPIRLFYPGSVTSHKNHEVIIRTLARRPNTHLVCTGSHVEQHFISLTKLAEQLGVSERIEWRGYVTAVELEREYVRAHILVMPSRWEAASGPIFEAIVRELPFIASDIEPIVAQLASIGLDVPTFPWDDPEAAAEALDKVIESYEFYRSELASAAESIRARTWKETSRDYLHVFDWISGMGDKPVHLQEAGTP
jgi:glycosyltransferase involved in cell wall biosynthesis